MYPEILICPNIQSCVYDGDCPHGKAHSEIANCLGGHCNGVIMTCVDVKILRKTNYKKLKL